MGGIPGAEIVTATDDFKVEIKAAVDAIQKKKDPSQLSALLSSCDPEDKKQLLINIQEAFRQRFGREFIRIDKDPQTQKENVISKEWTASKTDVTYLGKIANKIGEKLERAVLINPEDRTTKVKIEGFDSWLNSYNEYATTGKLQFIKEHCKQHWGGINVEFSRDSSGHLVASLKKGVSNLPAVPKAPLPTALKQEKDKTTEERQQEKDKPAWDKFTDAALDEAAELATLGSEVGDDIMELEFGSALDKISTYGSKKIETVATATLNSLSNAWEGTKELTQSVGEKIGFLSAKEPGEPEALEQPDVITEIDEKAGKVTFKIEVQELEEVEPTVTLSGKPTLILPKIPTEVEVREEATGNAATKLSTLTDEAEPEEVLLPVSSPDSKAASAPSVTLPERPLASVVEAEDHQPVSRSIRTEVTPELESSLSTLDLPIQSKSKYMDMMMTAMKTQLEEDGWDVDEEDEEKEKTAPTTPRAANVFQAVVRSLSQDAPVLAAQAAAEEREQAVEQTSRKAMAMVSPTITPTAESIRAAELALADLVNAKAPLIKIQKLSGLIQAANDRMKKQKAEDEVQDKRLYNV